MCYNNFLQISAPIPADTAGTVIEATASCTKQGARLFQIRSTESIKYFRNSESVHLGSQGLHMYAAQNSHIAIGMNYISQANSTYNDEPKLFYRYV